MYAGSSQMGKWQSLPNCPNLTSLVLCTIWSYSTSLHITPHIPIIEIRDTETAIIWKWGTLKQQVRYERVKWNSEGMAIDWGKLSVLKDLFFYFFIFRNVKERFVLTVWVDWRCICIAVPLIRGMGYEYFFFFFFNKK